MNADFSQKILIKVSKNYAELYNSWIGSYFGNENNEFYTATYENTQIENKIRFLENDGELMQVVLR